MDDNLRPELVEDGLNIAFGGYIASIYETLGFRLRSILRSKTEILVVASESIN